MTYNVNRNVMDTFYRYKMPRLIAKVEGKGNGIKTVIVNMVDIAKSLGRPPTYPTKYFGCELGAQTYFDFKNDRFIVNGSHEAGKLQSMLDGFIRKFVLCPECDNPETELWPNEKKGIIKQTCKACGYQGMVDMVHRLTTFILRNPPDANPEAPQQGNTNMKKNRRKESGDKAGSEKNGHKAAENAKHSNGAKNGLAEDDFDDDDWAVDVSEQAVKERQKTLTSGVKTLTVSSDDERTLAERLEIFFSYCKAKKESGVLRAGADVSVMRDVSMEADRLEIKDNKAVMAVVELLLDENIIKQVQQFRVLFLLFTHENAKVQRYMLGAIEKLIELKQADLMPKVTMIFKALYDTDIIEEEVFLEWGKKASKKYVAKETSQALLVKADPFLQWLKNADEESSDDTEEDDVELEFNERALVDSLRVQESKAAAAAAPATVVAGGEQSDEDDGEDVDIDNL